MTTIDATEHRHWVDKLKHARDQRIRWQGVEKDTLEELLALIGDEADEVLVDGRLVFSFKTSDQTRLSVKDVRAQYPEIAAELEKRVEQRSMKWSDES